MLVAPHAQINEFVSCINHIFNISIPTEEDIRAGIAINVFLESWLGNSKRREKIYVAIDLSDVDCQQRVVFYGNLELVCYFSKVYQVKLVLVLFHFFQVEFERL